MFHESVRIVGVLACVAVSAGIFCPCVHDVLVVLDFQNIVRFLRVSSDCVSMVLFFQNTRYGLTGRVCCACALPKSPTPQNKLT